MNLKSLIKCKYLRGGTVNKSRAGKLQKKSEM